MTLNHIRLKSGEDLVGELELTSSTQLMVSNAILIRVDPTLGIWANKWDLLDLNSTTVLDRTDVLYYGDASKVATDYYHEFQARFKDNASRDLSVPTVVDLESFMASGKKH